MHKTNNPQCAIFQHISVTNGALWDMGLVYCGICSMSLKYPNIYPYLWHSHQYHICSHKVKCPLQLSLPIENQNHFLANFITLQHVYCDSLFNKFHLQSHLLRSFIFSTVSDLMLRYSQQFNAILNDIALIHYTIQSNLFSNKLCKFGTCTPKHTQK